MPTDETTAADVNADISIVYTTWPDLASAELAATALLDARLAACLNIIPGMISLYAWEGRTQRASEVVMLIKTRTAITDACIACVHALHPYTNPAAIVLPVTGGAPAFLAWINSATS
jgi:periplasmic divalent cation tolerance protein